MKGGTLFSGIGSPKLAAPDIDWRWSAEIDPFASAVLAQRFPQTPNLGDVTQVDWDAVEPVDIIVFGSPCQSFSIAGKRAGLDDPRGNLALIGLQAVDHVRPRWVVFENVPGLLSSDEWRDFGAFLGSLGQCGYRFAYRVLDAQYFGVPQRRRRVFVVGHLGDWRPAAAVLFEPESLSWNSPPRREAGKDVARPIASCAPGGSGYRADSDTAENLIAPPITSNPYGDHESREGLLVAFGGNRQSGPIDIATAVNAHGGPHGRQDFETETFVTHALTAHGAGSAHEDGTGRGTPLVPVAFDTAYALCNPGSGGRTHSRQLLDSRMAVRRLTPVECEKLQGFPPGFTAISYRGKPAADGPRYRALGNAMAVPVIGWILRRVTECDRAVQEAAA